MKKSRIIITILIFLTLAVTVIGQSSDDTALIFEDHEKRIDLIKTNLDYVWVLISAALVFFMQAGFMALESGMARSKNSINVAIKNLTDFVLGVIGFWLVGFGIMFGTSWNGLFGTSDFIITIENPWTAAFFLFQAVFVGTAATIDSGAVCERAKLKQYVLLSLLMSVIIYPVFGHWAWGSFLHGSDPLTGGGAGWLEARGFKDFAGSSVVHSVGGWMALAGVIVVGPRIGKFETDPKTGKKGKPNKIAPGDMRFVFLGTFILFFGWFGFNCGSTLAAVSDIAPIGLNTTLAACFGCLASSLLSWISNGGKKIEGDMIANGVLAGLVAITAGCAFVDTKGAMIIGLVSGVLVFYGVHFLERVLKLDDVVSAIPVHGICGAWGTLAVGFFIKTDFLGEMTRMEQIQIQGLGVLTCFAWTFSLGLLFYFLIDKFAGGVRVSPEEEAMGLNIAEHGASSSIIDLASRMNDLTNTGDFSGEIQVDVEEGTEIGDLARLFNRMIVKIKEALNESQIQKNLAEEMLRESEEQKIQVLKTQEELKQQRLDSSTQRNSYMNQTIGKVSQVSSRIDGISDYIQHTAFVTGEMNTSFQTLTETLGKMLDSLGGAHQRLSQMERISQSTNTTAQDSRRSVSDLQAVTDEIREMVKYINDIAEKTHILSINSSIEAARAGSDGKGFVVISKEVRELSQQTAQTAGDIEEKLSDIVQRVGRVSHSMENIFTILDEIGELNHHIITIVNENQDHSNSIKDQSTDTIKSVGDVAADMEKLMTETVELSKLSKSVEMELEKLD